MRAAWIGCALLVVGRPCVAQLPSASSAALGMGDNYTAAARGYNAVAWNPSALGLGSGPRGSFTLAVLRGANGLAPVTLGDFAEYADRVVPDAVRRDWMARITAGGGQHGEGEVGGTWLAAQYGPFAVHAGSRVRALSDITPGIAELLMFGNGDAAADVRDIDLSGATLGARAWSSIGASAGLPVALGTARLALGATVTWTMGHLLGSGEHSTGAAASEPVSVRLDFPVVQTTFDRFQADAGSGFGLDLAASLEAGDLTLAGVVHNVVNTFSWDLDRLEYRPLTLSLDQADAQTETTAVPFADAPEDVRERIRGLGFDPSWALGIAWQPDPRMRLAADARFAGDDDMLARPARHIGAGVEVRIAPWLPLRAGGAWLSETVGDRGWQASTGLGLEAGPWGVSVAAARRSSDRLGSSTVLMLSMTSVGTH